MGRVVNDSAEERIADLMGVAVCAVNVPIMPLVTRLDNVYAIIRPVGICAANKGTNVLTGNAAHRNVLAWNAVMTDVVAVVVNVVMDSYAKNICVSVTISYGPGISIQRTNSVYTLSRLQLTESGLLAY